MSVDDLTQKVERSVRFSDGMECRITVEMVKDD
jgi:hypothetical protein